MLSPKQPPRGSVKSKGNPIDSNGNQRKSTLAARRSFGNARLGALFCTLFCTCRSQVGSRMLSSARRRNEESCAFRKIVVAMERGVLNGAIGPRINTKAAVSSPHWCIAVLTSSVLFGRQDSFWSFFGAHKKPHEAAEAKQHKTFKFLWKSV